jgi:hypothetical protein
VPASASGWVPSFIFLKVDSHVFYGLQCTTILLMYCLLSKRSEPWSW